MIKKTVLLMCLMGYSIKSFACTGWAAINPNGDVLIAKNRDAIPTEQYVMVKHAKKDPYSFIGLYALGKNQKKQLRAGINEKNLVATSLTATVVPSSMKKNGKSVMSKILARYSSVQKISDDKETLFNNVHPMFYMFADNKNIAYVEIAPDHKFSFVMQDKGILAHTNHYLTPNLSAYNIKTYPSSHKRLDKMNNLLKQKLDNYTFADFKNYSEDTSQGANDSILRTAPDEFKERTVATWIVTISNQGKPNYVYIKLFGKNGNATVVEGSVRDLFAQLK